MKRCSTSDRLKEIMKEKGLKQIDIVNLCQPYCEKFNAKLQKNDLSQYVSGKVEPSQYKLTILGLALNVSESWLMGFDVDKERDDSPKPYSISDLNEQEKKIVMLFRSLSQDKKKLFIEMSNMFGKD